MAKGYGSRGGSDRKDGRLLRTLDSFARFIPFFFSSRRDAFDYYEDSYELTESERWIRAQHGKGYKRMSFLHLLIAAYIRVISALPALNRFVAGKHIFARNGIFVTLMVKKDNTDDAPQIPVKVRFEPSDTIYDVYNKVNIELEKVKEDDGNDATVFAAKIAKFPRFLSILYLLLLRALDYFGIMPQRRTDMSPFHSSVIISDMSCMGASPMHHHIHSMGNVPVYISYGARQRLEDSDDSGKVIDRKFVEARFSLDSRIVDTHYYAAAFKLLRKFIEDPQQLEVPPVKVHDDIY